MFLDDVSLHSIAIGTSSLEIAGCASAPWRICCVSRPRALWLITRSPVLKGRVWGTSTLSIRSSINIDQLLLDVWARDKFRSSVDSVIVETILGANRCLRDRQCRMRIYNNWWPWHTWGPTSHWQGRHNPSFVQGGAQLSAAYR